jgi:hypothetical protein
MYIPIYYYESKIDSCIDHTVHIVKWHSKLQEEAFKQQEPLERKFKKERKE